MPHSQHINHLLSRFPEENSEFSVLLKREARVIEVAKNEHLISFQSSNRKIYFVAEGSFIRYIITSKGELKTVMFHTESFCEFFKSYDTVYSHRKTNYEIVANEPSVVLAVDYDVLMNELKDNLEFLQFYIVKTEELFLAIDLFRNFQLGLSSEEYLEWLLNNYSFLFRRFPAQNIASFMGITPVWLSKLRAGLNS